MKVETMFLDTDDLNKRQVWEIWFNVLRVESVSIEGRN